MRPALVDTAGAVLGVLAVLLLGQGHRLLHVAVGLLQERLALHQAQPGGLAELIHSLSRDLGHRHSPRRSDLRILRRRAMSSIRRSAGIGLVRTRDRIARNSQPDRSQTGNGLVIGRPSGRGAETIGHRRRARPARPVLAGGRPPSSLGRRRDVGFALRRRGCWSRRPAGRAWRPRARARPPRPARSPAPGPPALGRPSGPRLG